MKSSAFLIFCEINRKKVRIMSGGQQLISSLSKIAGSQSFKNFSGFYLKYLKTASGIGAVVGTVIATGHLLDCNKAYKKEVKKMKARGGDPDDVEELSYLYTTSVMTAGPLIGASAGVMWPVTVVFGPLYYVFGEYLGPIFNSLLALSLIIAKEDFEGDNKKRSFSDSSSIDEKDE